MTSGLPRIRRFVLPMVREITAREIVMSAGDGIDRLVCSTSLVGADITPLTIPLLLPARRLAAANAGTDGGGARAALVGWRAMLGTGLIQAHG